MTNSENSDADRAMRAKAAPEDIRSILVRCREFIDTTKIPAYPAGADLADEIDALLAAQAAPAAVAGVDELAELSLLNRLIDLGSKAAGAHAASNSDDGDKGTAAYAQWRELRAQMGELIRAAYAAPATQAVPAAQGDAEDAARWRETLMHVGAAYHLGGQHFTLNTLRITDQMFLLRGSVAQHFAKCIDASRAARSQAKEGGAEFRAAIDAAMAAQGDTP